MSQRSDLLRSIASTVSDYRQGEIPAITPDHVDTWVTQFAKEDQLTILSEMDHILANYYMSRDLARGLLANLIGFDKVFGSAPQRILRQTKFLSIQGKGNSQNELLALIDEIIQDKYGFTTSDCGEKPIQYVYLDDGVFSGNTAWHDCNAWLPQAVEGTAIHFIFFTTHSCGLNYFKRRFDLAARKKGVSTNYWAFRKFENDPRNGSKFECLWPKEIAGDDLIDSYIAEIRQRCEGKSYKPRLFRPRGVPRKETIFSSSEARDVVERAFLRAGARIMSLPQNPQHSMRPLGYEYLESLGFGSIFVSYRNIPNNCPLVLWWGNPGASPSHPLSKWYPLFPRKVNVPSIDDLSGFLF